ncbi:MAG: elongation factor G [candidate division WOR-3 bacterium]
MRVVLFTGHGGCGKTQLAEAILYKAKVTTRLGNPSQGNSILDYDPEEIERKISINLSCAHFKYKNEEFEIIDTPGFLDFQGEFIAGIEVTDGVILVIDSTSGIQTGTEIFGQKVFERKLPCMIFVSKMKMENSNPDELIERLKETFEGVSFFPLQFPKGKGVNFEGTWNIFDENLPADLKKIKEKYMESVIELSEELVTRYLEGEEIGTSELKEVLKRGVKNGEIVPVLYGDSIEGIGIEELLDAIIDYFPSPFERKYKAFDLEENEVEIAPSSEGNLVSFVFKTFTEPHLGEIYYIRVFNGELKAGTEVLNANKGTKEKINQIFKIIGKERKETEVLKTGEIGAVVKLKNTTTSHTLTLPEKPLKLKPIEFPNPSISIAVVPLTKQDEEKVMEALQKVSFEDPTFRFYYDPELKQRIIEGLGSVHLDVIISKIKRKFGVNVRTERPKIPYRETIRKKAEAMGKYVKQSGGRGQYGICFIRIEPKKRGEGYEFVNDIFGGAIPSNFIPAVETGIKKAMQSGVLAGYPVVDVKVTLYDGKYHEVDSSNIAFEIAGSMAFREAQQKAEPYLLEPIYEIEVIVPEEYMGEIIGDLNARRGKILGMEGFGKKQKIKAYVPLAEIYRYADSLKSITKGKGVFSMKFSHYEEVPSEIAARVINESKKEKGEE